MTGWHIDLPIDLPHGKAGILLQAECTATLPLILRSLPRRGRGLARHNLPDSSPLWVDWKGQREPRAACLPGWHSVGQAASNAICAQSSTGGGGACRLSRGCVVPLRAADDAACYLPSAGQQRPWFIYVLMRFPDVPRKYIHELTHIVVSRHGGGVRAQRPRWPRAPRVSIKRRHETSAPSSRGRPLALLQLAVPAKPKLTVEFQQAPAERRR